MLAPIFRVPHPEPPALATGACTRPGVAGSSEIQERGDEMEEETRNPLEVRDLMTRVASGVDPEETTPWEQVAPRQIDGADLLRFEGYVSEIFTAFGLQLDTPGTRRTPTRFLKALYDATAGYEGDHKLMTVFGAEHRCDPGPSRRPSDRRAD